MLQVILTGGTFDKDYDRLTGEVVFFTTHFHRIAHNCALSVPVKIKELFLKDSLQITKKEREQILQAIANSPTKKVIVIHGTDTMVETAQMVEADDKTVIFTGSMRPWALGNSDAEFNLGMAIGLAQSLHSGCYITMGGQYWQAHGVQKNRKTGIFSSLLDNKG